MYVYILRKFRVQINNKFQMFNNTNKWKTDHLIKISLLFVKLSTRGQDCPPTAIEKCILKLKQTCISVKSAQIVEIKV